MKIQKISAVLFVLTASVMFVLMILPGKDLPLEIGNRDKIAHAGSFFFLAFFFLITFRRDHWKRWQIILLTVAACAGYGALIEFIQGFTGRDPDIFDFLADCAGTVLGAAASLLLLPRLPKH